MSSADEIVQEQKRSRALHGLAIRTKRGLEIGPLSRPLVRHEDSSVLYIDHCSREELVRKYVGDPNVPADKIEHVDIVADGGQLGDLLGGWAPLDYVVASHVVEHVPDLVGWLMGIWASLHDGGTLVLVVPDKRFTFDVWRRETAFEEVEAAYQEKRRRPGLRCIMDHFANVVQASAWHLWEDYSGIDKLPFHHSPEFLSLAARDYAGGKYIDVHCWVFTPRSVFEVLDLIIQKCNLGFELQYFLTTQSHDWILCTTETGGQVAHRLETGCE